MIKISNMDFIDDYQRAAWTRYNFDKLIDGEETYIKGIYANLKVAANNYSNRHQVKLRVLKHLKGALVTKIDLIGRLEDIKPKEVNFFTQSEDVYINGLEQFKILEMYRDNLDQRMINNSDKNNDKCIFFEESKKVTKFINQINK